MINKLKKFFCRRAVIISAVVLLQLALLFFALLFYSRRLPLLGAAMRAFTVAAAVYLISRSQNPAYKLAWVTLMLVFPEIGGAAYLLGGNKRLPNKLKKRLAGFYRDRLQKLAVDSGADPGLAAACPEFYPISAFLKRSTGFPAWANTRCEFFPTGGSLFEELCRRLGDARRFVFMEYFIISSGALLGRIEKILIEKRRAGVAVRIMYDDMGCIDLLEKGWRSRLESEGIELTAFNRCRPHLNPAMNYRDHRKLCIIDGDVGFCGGANVADEYVNRLPRCGHWKDTGVMLHGDGVWNLTLLFLNLWDFSRGTLSELPRFVPSESCVSDGFVQPFGDSPLDELCVAESVCLMSISRARRYIYITTPYLIPDCEMIKALASAALSGADVRIITPAVPDKWYVHAISRSFYRELICHGVRIFEYSPGFIHSKQLVCDDCFAMVGTANMDFRSFYLHFESAVCLYGSGAVGEVKRDIEASLQCCREVTFEDTLQFPLIQRLTAAILRPFSPLF